MLTTQQISLTMANWKSGKPLGLSMTFVGSIRPNDRISRSETLPPKDPIETIAAEKQAPENSDPSDQPTDTVDPTEEDFVFATFRALSATILADRPIDFTDEKMLKAAVAKLNGQTVFKDHNTSVNNWVGRVESSHWDDTTPGIPSGINAILKLDAVKDPMTVRGVLQGGHPFRQRHRQFRMEAEPSRSHGERDLFRSTRGRDRRSDGPDPRHQDRQILGDLPRLARGRRIRQADRRGWPPRSTIATDSYDRRSSDRSGKIHRKQRGVHHAPITQTVERNLRH